MAVEQYFASKNEDFFSRRLDKLLELWQTIITNEKNTFRLFLNEK